MSRRLLPLLVPLVAACKAPPPPANPEFSDAAVFAFVAFEAPEAELAFALRHLEVQAYGAMDIASDQVQERAFTINALTDADVEGLERPDRPIADTMPVAVAGASPHDVALHVPVQLMVDHTPVEPYSPDFYDRTFLEGTEECWADHGCSTLHTWNDLVKDNALMTVPYSFFKDFRWVDLGLPDPASVDDDEEPINDGEPRWAIAARSWTTEVFEGENGATAIQQSYTIELWIPRDGRGPLDSPDTEWTSDSTGGGTLRFLALWHETKIGLNVSDDLVAKTTRAGIDDNFQAADDYITEHLAR